jgi:hypothetical protein
LEEGFEVEFHDDGRPISMPFLRYRPLVRVSVATPVLKNYIRIQTYLTFLP